MWRSLAALFERMHIVNLWVQLCYTETESKSCLH